MLCAASRVNTAGPVASRRAGPGLVAAKAARRAVSASSCAPISIPAALVWATSSARSCFAANQTPSATRMWEAPIQAGARAAKAPIGSGRPNWIASGAAEPCNICNSRARSARSASSVNAAAVVAGDSSRR